MHQRKSEVLVSAEIGNIDSAVFGNRSLQVLQSTSPRLGQQPAKEVARLNQKWKNKSSAFLRLRSCCFSLISIFYEKVLASKKYYICSAVRRPAKAERAVLFINPALNNLVRDNSETKPWI